MWAARVERPGCQCRNARRSNPVRTLDRKLGGKVGDRPLSRTVLLKSGNADNEAQLWRKRYRLGR